ncbi:MAG: hypothetical protein QXX41_05715 [Nitrososphaerota archaeon]
MMLKKIPEWACPLLGAASGAISNIILYKLVDAFITGPHKIYDNPNFQLKLHYNDDNALNQAIGLIITGLGLIKKDTKILGFGAGWALEEFIGKFVIEGKNAGVYGKSIKIFSSPTSMSQALTPPMRTASKEKSITAPTF